MVASLRILPDVVPRAALPHGALTNVDPFGRVIDYLRISITDRCNLRCVYCMPAEGVQLGPRHELLSFEEIWRVAAAARSLGFEKFRITGGEPLIVRDVLSFVAGLRHAVGDAMLCLTTNGVRLPELAVPLRRAGIARVNISLDALTDEGFAAMTRRDHLHDVLRGIDAALAAGFERVKINAVITPGHNEDQLEPLARLAERMPLDVRFIEQMPLDGASERQFLGAEIMLERLRRAIPLHAVDPDDPRASARLVYSAPGWRGRVAFIAPRSQKFCQQCHRLRLTPKGELKGCLLTEGTVDLRSWLRDHTTHEDLRRLLAYAIGIKPLAYRDEHYGLDRSMSAIGG